MCRLSSTQLIYEDYIEGECKVRWLDCNTTPSKLGRGGRITHTQRKDEDFEESEIEDMCCLENDTKIMIVIVTVARKLRAFDKCGNFLWESPIKLPKMNNSFRPAGVAITKRDDCLFVVDDSSNCVHMFSSDGEYLYCVLESKNIGLGSLQKWVRWCNKISSLVVVDIDQDGGDYINIMKLVDSDDVL